MAVNHINLLSYDNVAKDWEEGEDGWKRRCSVDDQEWDMVDFEAVGEVANAGTSFVCMGNDYDFVTAIDELGRELVDVAFDSPGLWKEEVADHSNVVRHDCGGQGL